MSWIKVVSYNDAVGKLKKLYDRIKGPDNNVDNVMMIHSLRPHSMVGHMYLYKNVLHHSGNTLDKSFLEALGVYVSYLNKCDYCYQHHFAGYSRLINDSEKSNLFKDSIESGNLEAYADSKELSAFEYAKALTLNIVDVNEESVEPLKTEGFTDGEILEINQVVSYFNYANRTVLGLGVSIDGDIVGLSPNDSDDPDNWGHS